MISDLPSLDYPNWLKSLDAVSIVEDKFPLKEILADSLYYPSSGFDGDPVRYLGGNVYSFIYVDYGRAKEDLDTELENDNFKGYKIVGRREVSEQELNPNRLVPSAELFRIDGDPRHNEWLIKKPFCEWLIFQRDRDLDHRYGPERFSLVYLSADGAASYQILYTGNGQKPLMICLIQPGEGFGGNWTDFKDPKKILARLVRDNEAGIPKFLLENYHWKPRNENSACWPHYDSFICSFHKSSGGNIHAFTTSDKLQ
jgi:hypothetical protein